MSISGLMDKQILLCPYSGLFFSYRKNEALPQATAPVSLEHIRLR